MQGILAATSVERLDLSPSPSPQHTLAATLVALALLPAAASAQESDDDWLRECRDRDRDRLVVFCDVRVQRLPATGAVDVNATPNGGIHVIAWDRAEVEIHTCIQARAESELAAEALAGEVQVMTDGGRIRSEGPENDRAASWHASFVVYTPARSDVTIESHNGPVAVRGVTGQMDVRTENGPLSLRDVGGDIRARTRNGPLHVELTGTSWDGAGLDAETQNGPVQLVIPEGYSAELETGTVNGPMDSEVPLMVRFVGRRASRIETTLGSGGAPLRVVTTNGPITLRQR
ncbi:MAG: DUF4097 family beta strand repeat-containing protein [Planctomycetaceae bacterium]